jgi:hypothetical protein
MPILEGTLGRWEVPHLHYWKDRGLLPDRARAAPLVGCTTRIATIGSCFASHLARVLDERGFTIGMHPGGIWYNTASMAQELEHLFGERNLDSEPAWETSAGQWVHPFKDYHKQFPTQAALAAWSADIDARARKLFSTADVIVVTLGLTEVWESTASGLTFIQIPVPDLFRRGCARFRPTTVEENRANLERIYQIVKRHTRAEMVFTVSPVPLYATFRDMDVRIANTISKSTLRSALADLLAAHPDVHYFHSYEIATALDRPQALFEDDARHVRRRGVELIMDEFLRTFGDASIAVPQRDAAFLEEQLTTPDPQVPSSQLHRRIRRRIRRLFWRLANVRSQA